MPNPGLRIQVLVDHIDSVAHNLETKVPQVVSKAALDIEAGVKNRMSQPGRGRTYKGRRGLGSHTASAPGDPLATDTGQAINSIHTERDPSGMHITIFFDALQFVWGEYGTATEAPRPTITPAVEEVMPKFMQALEAVARHGLL